MSEFDTRSWQQYHDACVCVPRIENKVQCIWVIHQQHCSHASWYSHVFVFVFFAHKKYSRIFVTLRLNHWCYMDYFNDALTTFLGLEPDSCVTVYGGSGVLWVHQILLFLLYFWSALVSIRDLFQKHKKNLPTPNFWTEVYLFFCFVFFSQYSRLFRNDFIFSWVPVMPLLWGRCHDART